MEKLIDDCQIIKTYIETTYPQDEYLKNLIKSFHENLILIPNDQHTGITQDLSDVYMEDDNVKNSIKNNQMIFKASKNKTAISNLEKYEQVKHKLKNSLVKGDVVIDDIPISNNIQECLKIIKSVENTIRTHINRSLKSYANIGSLFNQLKIFDPDYQEVLKNHGCMFKYDYINFLIRLSELCLSYNKLLQCSLSIHYIKTNFKTIKAICDKGEF